jgi:hypothetical protein
MASERDDPEGGEHLVQMATAVEVPEDEPVQHQAKHDRPGRRAEQAQYEAAGGAGGGDGQIGAQHVLHAMRHVDEVHDSENQRQPCCDQE